MKDALAMAAVPLEFVRSASNIAPARALPEIDTSHEQQAMVVAIG